MVRHLNQRLSKNNAKPFVFWDTQRKHFTANIVIKRGGNCGLVAHSIE